MLTTLTPLRQVQQFLGINRANTQELVMALTYDDGPNPPYTQQLLTVLAKYQVQATFFMVGEQIKAHPDTVRAVAAAGHELGNHAYSHIDLLFKPKSMIRAEIEQTDHLLQVLGLSACADFRPPWGRRALGLMTMIAQMQKKIIMWDIDSQDYNPKLSPEQIAQRVIERARPGAIVLMHDGPHDRSRSVAATDIILQTLSERGYRFQTITEMIGCYGNQ